MIGDSDRDVKAGKNAGVKEAIKVENLLTDISDIINR